jgi:TetR/AcrR family transcriptional repressor of bet genes
MARPSNTAERRTEIARALLKVMAKTGFERATVADVAKVAGIAPGLVHYHFKSKLDMLLGAIEELARDYDARLERHLFPAGADPERELAAFVDAHLRAGEDADPDALACWIDIGGESLREVRVKKAFARIVAAATRRLRDILDRGNRAHRFSCKHPDAAAAAIVATIQGYFLLGAAARDVIPPGSAAQSTMAMCRGLLGQGAGPARRTSPAASRSRRTSR